MKVYMIAGKAGAGKNTTANYIKEYYESIGKKTIITEMSKYLKLYAEEIVDWDRRRETKPRTFLQSVGDFVRKEAFTDTFFIDRILEDMKVYEKFADIVIIADVRYPMEIKAIENKYDSISIEVINEFSEYDLKPNEKNHASENALNSYKEFNYIIHNKTFENLKEDAINIVKEVENNEK